MAVEKVLPSFRLCGGQALGNFYLYSLRPPVEGSLADSDVKKIKAGMTAIIDSKLPIVATTKDSASLSKYFGGAQQHVAAKLITKRTAAAFSVHECDGCTRLAHFDLYGNTGEMIGFWDLTQGERNNEIILHRCHSRYKESETEPMLEKSIREVRQWGDTVGVTSIADLDGLEVVGRGRKDFALQSEFRQDMKIAEIVSKIAAAKTDVKLICIAGPTSSGKTTFATKLSMYLNNIGRPAIPLTVDHYYLPLAEQPDMIKYKDRTKVDYDSIQSMDIELVQKHLSALIKGEKVMTPEYSFHTGNRVPPGHALQLPARGILVIEGIHALNPEYTKSVPREKVFKIFLSPITNMQLDDFNVLKSTHARLFRRMSRDYLFRGHSASHTLRMWGNVRRGEGKWIFPFQNDVDYICNSALEYELGVL